METSSLWGGNEEVSTQKNNHLAKVFYLVTKSNLYFYYFGLENFEFVGTFFSPICKGDPYINWVSSNQGVSVSRVILIQIKSKKYLKWSDQVFLFFFKRKSGFLTFLAHQIRNCQLCKQKGAVIVKKSVFLETSSSIVVGLPGKIVKFIFGFIY